MEDNKVKQTIELNPITEQYIKALNLIKEGATVFSTVTDERDGKDKDKVEDLTIKFGDHIERATRMLIKEMFDYIKEDLINLFSILSSLSLYSVEFKSNITRWYNVITDILFFSTTSFS